MVGVILLMVFTNMQYISIALGKISHWCIYVQVCICFWTITGLPSHSLTYS